MAEIKSVVKRWEDMETDILMKIFKELNMIELAPVSEVCRSWRLACSDSWLWDTLDLGLLKSNYIPTRASPYIWVDDRSDRRLMRVLKTAMGLSRGNVTCMIFHFNLYMKDEHLSYIAERSPDIKRLVLPAWNRITKTGIVQAIRRWQQLESLTMPSIGQPLYIMEEINRNCKNFCNLKIMGTIDLHFASAIAVNIPNLKALSLRCSLVFKDALLFILDWMVNLEVLNISHSILSDGPLTSGSKLVMKVPEKSILLKASRLCKFIYCQDDSCTACQRVVADEGLMRWWRYEESFWRHDEITSLSLGECGKLFDERCVNQALRL